MFTKEVAHKVSWVLNTDVEREFILMLDNLIKQETDKLKANTSDADLRVIAIKKETYEKLKSYKQLIEDSRGR